MSIEKLPIDIQKRIADDFGEDDEVLKMMHFVQNDSAINVGVAQLIRSILIVAKGDKAKMKAIIDSRYHGDPRDLIMLAMSVSNQQSDYGRKPF
ncbi:MAG: hypothetical protein AAF927_28895 [Bacteroidota bacterium]